MKLNTVKIVALYLKKKNNLSPAFCRAFYFLPNKIFAIWQKSIRGKVMICENCKKEISPNNTLVCNNCQKYYCKNCAKEKNFNCGCKNKIGFIQ